MKITVLTHNLSSNAAMRAHRLALAASSFAEVKLLGPVERRGPWNALPSGVPIVPVPKRRFPDFFPSLLTLVDSSDGDVLLACKPHLASFGAALLAGEKRRVPVILDVDDLEIALDAGMMGGPSEPPRSPESRAADSVRNDLMRPGSIVYVSLLSRASGAAAAVTAASTALARRYGGVLVPHGVDPEPFDPAHIDREAARRRFGFGGPTVLFAGTPREHKGLLELAQAVSSLAGARLAVTCRPTDLQDERWQALGVDRLPMVPYEELPQLLAAADVVAIPQRDEEAAAYQMPMKVYDAMAAGKAIVASAVSDLPLALEGCGLLTQPGDVNALAAGLAELLRNPDQRAELGLRARRRILERYSLRETSRLLQEVVGRVIP